MSAEAVPAERPPEAWTTAQHVERYGHCVKICRAQLQTLWDVCELPSEAQAGHLATAGAQAEAVWSEAVACAERLRDGLRERVEEAHLRIAKLQAELADEVFPDAEPQGAAPPLKTLKAELDAAEALLQLWQGRKAQRQQKYEALKEECEHLRKQLGTAGSSVPVKSVTLYVLDGLAHELRKLRAEQAERQHRLDVHLKELRWLCLELGEDVGTHTAGVHASLAASRDALSSVQDLSDRTFDGLRHKALELQDLMRAREEQGESLLHTLASLWDALGVPADDVDRELFGRLLAGPSRLHQSAIDQCKAEVVRLEGARKDLMLGIIESKRQELVDVCAAARLAVPPLPEMPGERGEVADLLARVLKQVAVARAESEARQEVLACAAALEAAQSEAGWLATYEADPNKYKGRDSTRNIQRAIQAQEQRKQLPALVAETEAALAAFRARAGKAFLLEGRDYQMELAALRLRLDLEAQLRAQSKGAPGSARKGPPSARSVPASPLTPRRPKAGARASQDGGGSARKPAVPSPTPARRRTECGAPRTASLLSRADSNASRLEASLQGAADLSDRARKLLQSQPPSRTASGASVADVDRERAGVTAAPGGKASRPAPPAPRALPGAGSRRLRLRLGNTQGTEARGALLQAEGQHMGRPSVDGGEPQEQRAPNLFATVP